MPMNAKSFLILLALLLSFGSSAWAADSGGQFAFCPRAKFADCTQAVCTPTGTGTFSCKCKIKTKYSATALVDGDAQKSCVTATDTTVQSRYAPVKKYETCESANPAWAMCLGDPCTITDGKKSASCQCSSPTAPPALSPYVIATGKYVARRCTNGKIYSSVSPDGLNAITAFLQTKVPNVPAPELLTASAAPKPRKHK
jgi:hypothetical protein